MQKFCSMLESMLLLDRELTNETTETDGDASNTEQPIILYDHDTD